MLIQQWMIVLLVQFALLVVGVAERLNTELGLTPQPPADVVVTVGE
jgi:hypothetical protein